MNDVAQSLLWAMIFWLSAVIDGSSTLSVSSSDPFAAPSLVGVKGRALKVSMAKRNNIVRLQASGDVFRSGRQVLRGMKLLGYDGQAENEKSANKWVHPWVFQYMYRLQEVFHYMSVAFPVFSIAWDATRLSKLDIMASTIYNHALQLAAWCPPQAIMVLMSSVYFDLALGFDLCDHCNAQTSRCWKLCNPVLSKLTDY